MDKTLFNSTLRVPVIITELKHSATSQVARQVKSTPITSFQIAPEQGLQHPPRGSFDSSSLSSSESQDSLTAPEPVIVLDAESGTEENRAGADYQC